jgi:Raf kinase inhibitor-like YbhB/YbcL family protein
VPEAGPGVFELTSPSYDSLWPDGGGGDGGPTIPVDDTCAYKDAGGYGVFPGLDWSGAPAATMSYAIVFHDLTNMFFHWAIWDIPAATTSLPEGLAAGKMLAMPAGAMQWSFMGPDGEFTGPCPSGALHVYRFDIFALGTATLQVNAGANATDVYTAAAKAALATTSLTGLSNAKHY